MRWMLLVAMLGCGGGTGQFAGDEVVAELRAGQPYCGPGKSGPTITHSTATAPAGNGTTYEQQIVECDWTCADTGVFDGPRFASAVFHTDPSGLWLMNHYVDPRAERVVCPH